MQVPFHIRPVIRHIFASIALVGGYIHHIRYVVGVKERQVTGLVLQSAMLGQFALLCGGVLALACANTRLYLLRYFVICSSSSVFDRRCGEVRSRGI